MECRKILVPVDGTDASIEASKLAIELAKAAKATIEYLYVADMEQAFINGRRRDSSALEMTVAEGRQVLDNAMMDTPSEVPARARCVSGFPRKEIMRFIDEDECDMVVMGTSGDQGFKAVIMDSVSSYILQHARCPVTLVKADDTEKIEDLADLLGI